MSHSYMRVIVFFDLPSVTVADKRQYLTFRKFLLSEGFIMLQESVYSKLALNSSTANLIKNRIRKYQLKGGIVQILVITEKQFAGIEYLCGQAQSTIEDSERRLIII